MKKVSKKTTDGIPTLRPFPPSSSSCQEKKSMLKKRNKLRNSYEDRFGDSSSSPPKSKRSDPSSSPCKEEKSMLEKRNQLRNGYEDIFGESSSSPPKKLKRSDPSLSPCKEEKSMLKKRNKLRNGCEDRLGESSSSPPKNLKRADGDNEEENSKLHRLILAVSRSSKNPTGRTEEDWDRLIRRLQSDKKRVHNELKIRDGGFNRIPLHSLLSIEVDRDIWEKRLEAVELCVDKYPKSLMLRDVYEGYTPLHMACTHDDIDPELIQLLVSRKPELVCAGCETGEQCNQDSLIDFDNEEKSSNALHIACEKCPRLDILSIFTSLADIELSRRCLTMLDGYDNLPLHVAVDSVASLNTVKFLISGWKRLGLNKNCLTCKNQQGMTPLHYACLPGVSKETFSFLTTEAKETMWMVDSDGDLPIHVVLHDNKANKNSSSAASKIDKISILLEVSKEENTMLGIRNKKNEMPLHILCKCKDSTLSTLRLILQKGPDLYKEKDARGNTALHLVLSSGLSPALAYELVNHDNQYGSGMSSVLLQKNNKGKTPLDIVSSIVEPTGRQRNMINMIRTNTHRKEEEASETDL